MNGYKLIAVQELSKSRQAIQKLKPGERVQRIQNGFATAFVWANSLRTERNVIHEAGNLPSDAHLGEAAGMLMHASTSNLDFLARMAGYGTTAGD